MTHRWLIVGAMVALIGLLAWFTLGPDGPMDPDGNIRERPDEVDVEPGGNGKIPVAEPFRGEDVVEALRAGQTGEARLADLARSKDGVEQILAALAVTESAENRALLLLHLMLGKTIEGRDAVFRNARGEGRKADRIPAILALAGGDESAARLLVGLLAAREVDEIVLVATYALALRADDRAFLALEDAVTRMKSTDDRIRLYSALQSAPGSSQPGPRFHALLTAGSGGRAGLEGADTGTGPYRRLIDRIAGEDDARAMRAALDVLLHMPGPDSKGGVLRLWRGSEGEVRRELTDAAVSGLDPNDVGSPAGLVTIAREGKGEEQAQIRERVLQRFDECRDRDAIPVLRDWAQSEEDPAFRDRLEDQIRRIEEEPD